MRSDTFILLLVPLIAQCAPLVNRAGSSSSDILSSSSVSLSASTASISKIAFTSSVIPFAAQSPSSSTLQSSSSIVSASHVSETLQPEIITSPKGSETVFIAPGSSNDSQSNGGVFTQGVRPLLMGYYPSWSSGILTPEQINFEIYDVVVYAFATLNEALQLTFDDPSCSDLLRRLVNAAHAKGKCVQLSIGGWDGSRYFSSAVSTPGNRQSFVQQLVELYQNYKVDGFDFDWEYPGLQGNTENQVDSQDSTNLLEFIQLLRSALSNNAVISAAVVHTPFAGPDTQPMQDVSSFAESLDWITIMNYDVFQSSSTPGPNAPLSDRCNNSTQPQANAARAFDQWTRARFPADKLVLGVPYYGYVSSSNASTLRSRASSPSTRLNGDADGSIPFLDLVGQGALVCRNGIYTASNGFVRSWDQCSSTPFLRSEASRQVVSYDDPQSLSMKAQFVRETGMLGTNAWDMTNDINDVLGLTLKRGLA